MTGAVTGRPTGDVSGRVANAHPGLPGLPHLTDVQPISRDGAGIIYTATDLRLERRVSVRVLKPPADDAERQRFERDSKMLGRLSAHPNVATVYESGITPAGQPFMVTELIDGETLADLIARQGALNWQAAADIALQVCAGLGQAHQAGALHRDLRPETIYMVGATPKLSAFGIAGSGPPAGWDEDMTALTHRAPETFDHRWDERTDLYSLASMLYELVDGHPPFWRPGADSAEGLRFRLRQESPPGLDPDLGPPAFDMFVSAGLSKDPFDRPQTADEFARELQLIRDGRTTGSTPSVLHGTTGTMALPLPNPTPSPLPGGSAPSPIQPIDQVPAPVGPGIPAAQWAPPTTDPSPVAAPPPPAPAPERVGSNDGSTAVFDRFVPADSSIDHQSLGQPLPPANGFDGGDQGPHVHTPEPELIDLGPIDDPIDRPEPRRSSARRAAPFTIAMTMIAVGLIGLLIVVALSALRSDDDNASAPVLPDPNQPATVEAGADAGAGGSSATTAMADGEAMDEEMVETTEATVAQSTTSETTIPRLAVPNLVGFNVEAATKQLSDAGFQVIVIGRTATNGTPGLVTQQKPDGGSLVALPLTVTLYIPKVSNLPAMVGRSADAVCLELQALSLRCNRTTQYSNQVPAGSVVSTNPIEGTLFNEGSTVDIVVSIGPVTTVAVPNVAGLTNTEAEASLKAAGFTSVAFVTQASQTVPADQAIGSNPPAGTSLATDQPVTVVMSSGPPAPVTVPDVTGMTQSAAETTLTGAGFTVTVVSQDLEAGNPGIGMVLSTDPAPGTAAEAGSAVSITVGRQQAEVTTTTMAATTTTTAADAGEG